MKSLIVATALALTSTAALAQDAGLPVPVLGEVAWDVENETLGVEAGTEFYFGDFALAPSALMHYNDADSFNWDGLKVEATYGVTNNFTLFGNVTTDRFEYENAAVGVRFNF